MTIGKKPPNIERQVQTFLAAAETKRDEPYPITLRLDRDFLDRIDVLAKRKHISRSAWIKNALSYTVDAQEKE